MMENLGFDLEIGSHMGKDGLLDRLSKIPASEKEPDYESCF
jgi:hypothetical protein